MRHCACQTYRPLSITSLCCNAVSVLDHGCQILRRVRKHCGTHIAGKGIFLVGQEHYCHFAQVVTPKEEGLLVQLLRHNYIRTWDGWHPGQATALCLLVCVQDLGAIWPAIIRISGVVVDQEDVYIASIVLNEGPDWIILAGCLDSQLLAIPTIHVDILTCAAIQQVKLLIFRHKGRSSISIEWIPERRV